MQDVGLQDEVLLTSRILQITSTPLPEISPEATAVVVIDSNIRDVSSVLCVEDVTPSLWSN